MLSHARWNTAVGVFATVLLLAGCGARSPAGTPVPGPNTEQPPTADSNASAAEEPATEPVDEEAQDDQSQEETCDWDAPRLSGPAEAPEGREGDLPTMLVGSWQHTHTDEGAGFEEVANDHRFVFPAPDRMLYCQHVPGATDHGENAADIVLNGTKIELPGGKYGYTVLAWDEDTMLWDNPVGGGYVYLLQRR